MGCGRGSGDVAWKWWRHLDHGDHGGLGGWGGPGGVTGCGRGSGDVARRTVQIILKPPEHSKTTRTF